MHKILALLGLGLTLTLHAQTNAPPAPDISPLGGVVNNTFSAYVQGISNSWVYAWDPHYTEWLYLGRGYGSFTVDTLPGATNRVYAFQYVTGRGVSPSTYQDYVFKVATPWIQRNGLLVALTNATTSATIYYRTNTLATNWMVYSGSFYAPTNAVSAWASRTNFFNSDVVQEW